MVLFEIAKVLLDYQAHCDEGYHNDIDHLKGFVILKNYTHTIQYNLRLLCNRSPSYVPPFADFLILGRVGKPRLLINTVNRDVAMAGISLYRTNSLFSRLILFLLRISYLLHIELILRWLPINRLIIRHGNKSWIDTEQHHHDICAIYVGSDLTLKNYILLVASRPLHSSDSTHLTIQKIALTKQGADSLSYEKLVLHHLSSTPLQKYLLYSSSSHLADLQPTSFPSLRLDFHPNTKPIRSLRNIQPLIPFLDELASSNHATYKNARNCHVAVQNAKILEHDDMNTYYHHIHTLLAQPECISMHPSHGDFAVWNISNRDGIIKVFDWEKYNADDVLGSDLFYLYFSYWHYILKLRSLRTTHIQSLSHSFFSIPTYIRLKPSFKNHLLLWLHIATLQRRVPSSYLDNVIQILNNL